MRARWNRLSRRGKAAVVVVGVLASLTIIGALSSPDDGSDDTAAATTSTTTEQSPPATTTVEEQDAPEQQEAACVNVPPELVSGIADGLATSGKGTLRFARAVKSNDPEGYLISADIQAPGLEGRDDVATWARTGSDFNSGLIFAIDSVAREFSDWGADINEPSPAADLRQAFRDSPAFEQSRDCVNG